MALFSIVKIQQGGPKSVYQNKRNSRLAGYDDRHSRESVVRLKSKMNKHGQRSNEVSIRPRNSTSFWIALPKGVDDSEHLSQKLGLTPTATRKPPINALPPAAWILRIDSLLFQKDCQEHVDWLLEKLKGKEDFIRGLREKGYWVGVMCHWYWEYGKPELRLDTVKQLEDMEICLDFELED